MALSSNVWIARGLIAAVAIVPAYWAFSFSAGINLRRGNPELAYQLRPTDPGAVAAAMNDRLSVRNEIKVDPDDAANVRIALQRDPLNRALLRTTAIRAEVRGKTQAAYSAMSLGDRVSRRDPITQLWLAEYARRKRDYPQVAAHFDAALQVKSDLQPLVFPQMIASLDNARFRTALRPYVLSRQGTWAESFVGTAVLTDADAARLLIQPILTQIADGEFDLAFARLTANLAARGLTQQAYALAGKVFKGVNTKDFGDAALTSTSLNRKLGPLAWSFRQTGEISTSVDEQQRLNIAVLPLAVAEIAKRDILVQPGSVYKLSHKVEQIGSGGQARLRWTAGCVSDKQITAIWQGDAPQTTGLVQIGDRIEVPAGCHLLRLALNVIGPESQFPSELVISQLRLSPAGSEGSKPAPDER
jgi:hypothetical protein